MCRPPSLHSQGAGALAAGERYSICGQFAIGRHGQWRALGDAEQQYEKPQMQGIDPAGRAIQYGSAAERPAASADTSASKQVSAAAQQHALAGDCTGLCQHTLQSSGTCELTCGSNLPVHIETVDSADLSQSACRCT